jgi:hypothetical protein
MAKTKAQTRQAGHGDLDAIARYSDAPTGSF